MQACYLFLKDIQCGVKMEGSTVLFFFSNSPRPSQNTGLDNHQNQYEYFTGVCEGSLFNSIQFLFTGVNAQSRTRDAKAPRKVSDFPCYTI